MNVDKGGVMIVGWMQGVMMWEEDEVDEGVGVYFDPINIKQEGCRTTSDHQWRSKDGGTWWRRGRGLKEKG